jgi:hypothetical protein
MKTSFLPQRLFVLLAIVLPFWALTACNNDDGEDGSGPDTSKPTITLISDTEETVSAGSNLNIRATLSDDRQLASVRIEIHDAFDGHTHEKTSNTFALDTVIQTGNVRSFDVNINVLIPTDASTGPYHVMLNALDASGNIADFQEIDLTVTSASAPRIDSLLVNELVPAPEVIVNLTAGSDSLPQLVRVEVSDDQALDSLWLSIAEEDHDHDKTNDGEEPLYEVKIDIPLGAATYEHSYSFPFRRNQLENDKHYVLRIRVKDAQGNNTVREQEFHVFLQ